MSRLVAALLFAAACDAGDARIPPSADARDDPTGDVAGEGGLGDANSIAGDADLGAGADAPPDLPFREPPHFTEVTSDWLPALPLAIEHETYLHGGVGLVDVDADGDADLVLPTDGQDARLLRNDGDGRFSDDTAASGLAGIELGTSIGAADVDRDGDLDLAIGSIRGSSLWLNDGAGRFDEATVDWGLGRETVNAALVFGDFDGDGFVDLYETGYRQLGADPVSGAESRLYRNRGDHFEALAVSPGSEPAATLAANWHDFDGDGRLDLWVVRDYGLFLRPNQVFRNLGPVDDAPSAWRFEDVAPAWGWDQAVFGMTAALADFDNDGDFDGYTGNIGANLLLVAGSDGSAVDRARELGAAVSTFADPRPVPEGPPIWRDYDPAAAGPMEAALGRFCQRYCDSESGEWALTTWSSVFFDADQDGWQDLFAVNGYVRVFPTLPEGRGQYPVLLLNRGGRFEAADAGALPIVRGAGRGGAAADLDGDGDLDLVWVTNALDGPSALHVLENRTPGGHWLGVRLEGVASSTDGLGARVEMAAGGLVQARTMGADQGQYLSIGPRQLHFGLGSAVAAERLTVRWPSGRTQELRGVAADQVLTLREPD